MPAVTSPQRMAVPAQAWFSGLFYNHWYVHESSSSLGTSILECLMLLPLLSFENSWNQNTFIERGSFYSSYDVVMITWSWLVVYASKRTFSGLYLDLKHSGLGFYATICFIVTIYMENLARQWLLFIFVSEFLLRQRWWLHCLHIWLDYNHYNWPRFTLRLSKKNCSKHLLSLVLVWSAYTLNIQEFSDVLAVLHITRNFSSIGSSSKLEDGLLHLSQYSDLMEQRVIALIWIIFGLCLCILCSSFEDASVMNSSSLMLSFVELYVAPEASHVVHIQNITFGSIPRPPGELFDSVSTSFSWSKFIDTCLIRISCFGCCWKDRPALLSLLVKMSLLVSILHLHNAAIFSHCNTHSQLMNVSSLHRTVKSFGCFIKLITFKPFTSPKISPHTNFYICSLRRIKRSSKGSLVHQFLNPR